MENKILPEGWEQISLSDLNLFFFKGVNVEVKSNSGEYLFIPSGANFSTGIKIQKAKWISEGEFNKISKDKILITGDILFNSGGVGTLGRSSYYINRGNSCVCDSFIIVIRDIFKLSNTKFIYYWFQSAKASELIKENTKGTTGITSIKSSDLETFEITLPPLAEQHRIVVKLDDLFEKIESNKIRLEKIPIILKRFRQSVLAAAVSGRLTEDWRRKNKHKKLTINELISIREENHNEIGERQKKQNKKTPKLPKFQVLDNDNLPENWLSISVESATTFIIDCLHSTPKFTESGDLCIDTTCIEPFKILYTSARKITKESFIERTSRMSPEKGDILFSREGTIGTAVLYNGEFPICLGQRMMMFRFANYVSSKYAELYMGSFYFKQLYSPFISGTSAQHVNIGDIRPLEFLLPPTEEQKEIVKRVEQLFTFADKLEARYNKAKVMLDKLPQSILAKAFRGELVTQDPNDEPASMLLEKIKEEKEKLKVIKKKK